MQAVLERSERSDHLIELALRVRDELCDLGDLLGRGLERMLGHPAADFTPAAGLRTTVQYGVIAVTAAAQVLVALVLMLTYSPLVTLVYLAIAPLYAGLLWISGIGCAPPTTRSRKHLGNTSRVWDQFQHSGVLIGRMNDIIEPEPEQGADRSALADVPTISGQVSIRSVELAVAIVGRSGSGKTTLVRLLAGLLADELVSRRDLCRGDHAETRAVGHRPSAACRSTTVRSTALRRACSRRRRFLTASRASTGGGPSTRSAASSSA
jgi:hypothetical protein